MTPTYLTTHLKSETYNMEPIIKGDSALVVFSGGQDSTTCLFWALKNFKTVRTITFGYGQKHSAEIECAKAIAAKAGVDFHYMDVSFISQLGRNSLTDIQASGQLSKYICPRKESVLPQHRCSLCEGTWHQGSCYGSIPDRFQRLP